MAKVLEFQSKVKMENTPQSIRASLDNMVNLTDGVIDDTQNKAILVIWDSKGESNIITVRSPDVVYQDYLFVSTMLQHEAIQKVVSEMIERG